MNRFLLLKYRPYEFLTAAGIIVFFFCKLHDVPVPFHWDEMGVYVAAAFRMLDTGHISMLPNSIETLFSRGHPLLFTFCNALVFKVFGASVPAGHIYALLLAIATLVLFYIVAKNLFNRKVAFFSTVLLSAQPIFFSLSVQLLPEMMLTFFTLGSFYGFLKKKWALFAIFGSLAMLTKESAIVIPFTVLILLFVGSIRKKDFFTLVRFRQFLFASIPLFVFAIFLIIQKIQNGWFLFPEHIGYIHWQIDKLWDGGVRIFLDMFIRQGRWLIGVFYLAGNLLLLFSKPAVKESKRKVIGSFSVFMLLAFLFADVNFYMTRYLLYVIPFIVLGGTYTALLVFEKVFAKLKLTRWTLVICFCFAGLLFGHTNMKNNPDSCDMSYKFVVNVSQESILWAEQNWKNDRIEANFPLFQAIQDPRNGYLSGGPLNYAIDFTRPVRYGLIFYIGDKSNIPIGSSHPYHILKTFDEAWAHVAALEFEETAAPPVEHK